MPPELFRFPLSFGQQRLWFLEQLYPGTSTHNISYAFPIPGPVKVPLFQHCLRRIADRHETLRTTIAVVEGEPMQVVGAEATLNLEFVDLSAEPPAAQEARLAALAEAEAQRPFDLGTGPLLRSVLVKCSENSHWFILTIHHLICDGWSLAVFFRELSAFYQAQLVGQEAPLPPLPIQYADYAVWQRDHLSGDVLRRHLEFWRTKLAESTVLELPTDHPRPAVQSYRGAWLPVEIPPRLVAGLKELGREEGCTLFMTLLAGFKALLCRYTGHEDILVGVPVSGRVRPELEGLIGFFVNTLVMRTDLSGNPSFRQLMQRIRQTATETYACQELPFEKLVEELQLERDLSRQPLVQASFQLFTYSAAELAALRGRDRVLPGRRHASTFDVAVELWEAPGGWVRGYVEYNTDLLEPVTVQRMVSRWRRLLDGAAANPAMPIASLPLLTAAERRECLADANGPVVAYAGDACVHQLIRAQIGRTPDEAAVVRQGRITSYRELGVESRRLAQQLAARGIGRGHIVGLCFDRSERLVAALLAILECGAAYLPLDAEYPAERLRFMVADAGLRLVLTEPRHAPRLATLGAELIIVGGEAAAGGANRTRRRSPGKACVDDLAYVIYTSGSTGKPKGTCVTHRNLINYLSWAKGAYEAASGSGAVLHSSISFDLTVTSLFVPLLAGRAIHVVDEAAGIDGLAELLRTVPRLSFFKTTPAQLRLLSEQLSTSEAARFTRKIVIGGENLVAQDIAPWRRAAPDTELINEYGPTEATVGCCVYSAPPSEALAGSIPIGRPIANTRIYVLDGNLEPVPCGLPGMLFIGGDGVSNGYLARPRLTAERFLPDAFDTTGRNRPLYCSGDLARRRNDGNIEFLGRLDNQIKLRGFRIEPSEVEMSLRRCAGVVDAAVLAHSFDDQDVRLVAYVVLEDGPGRGDETVDCAASLVAELRLWLPRYMIPSVITRISALPLTINGKVDVAALASRPLQPQSAKRAFVPPSTALEQVLASLWEDTLHCGRVGVDDDFFDDLGGHSLLAAKLVARIRSTLRREIQLLQLFQTPTVARFADALRNDSMHGDNIERVAEIVLAVQRMSDEECQDSLPSGAPPPSHPLLVAEPGG